MCDRRLSVLTLTVNQEYTWNKGLFQSICMPLQEGFFAKSNITESKMAELKMAAKI